MKRREFLWIGGIVAALATVGALKYAEFGLKATAAVPAPNTAAIQQPREGDVVLGRADAPVTVLVLSSLTCPHCARWELMHLPDIEKALIETGKARIVIRDFPLNPPALDAAASARCLPEPLRPVARQALLATMNKWVSKDRVAIAETIGLEESDAKELAACAGQEKVRDDILAGAYEAMRAFNVQGTPTFVVGQRVVSGVQSVEALTKLVGEAEAAR